MKYTDSHCHLDFAAFDDNRDNLIKQCNALDINRIIVPAVSPNNWQKVLVLDHKLTRDDFYIHPCLGIHPWFLTSLDASHLDELSALIKAHKHRVIAIGETGIDGVIAKKYNNLPKQMRFFEFQLHLANDNNLPIVVHHQAAHHHVIALIKQIKPMNAGIIHAFSGSYQQAKSYLDLGFKLGIGGTCTYPRATKTIDTIKRLPIDSFVLETDAPAMPLYKQQGKINSPVNILTIFNRLCELRSESRQAIGEAINQNIEQLLKPPTGN